MKRIKLSRKDKPKPKGDDKGKEGRPKPCLQEGRSARRWITCHDGSLMSFDTLNTTSKRCLLSQHDKSYDNGMATLKVVPRPIWDSNAIFPPSFFMMFWQMGRPSPVPIPGGLVV